MVQVKLDIAADPGRIYNFLIDTGACVSILNISTIHEKSIIRQSNKIAITGIGETDISTFGTTHVQINIGNKNLPWEFQVCRGKYILNLDGIIGRDFLIHNKAAINFQTNTLHVPTTNTGKEFGEKSQQNSLNVANSIELEVEQDIYGIKPVNIIYRPAEFRNQTDPSTSKKSIATISDELKDSNIPTNENKKTPPKTHTNNRIIEDALASNKHQPELRFGSFSQADERFSAVSRNKQCTAIAMTALVYAQLYSIHAWRNIDLDYIVNEGDKVYTSSYNNSNGKFIYLAADEIIPSISIDGKQFDVKCVMDLTSINSFDKLTLGAHILDFYKRFNSGILTYNNKSIALLKGCCPENELKQIFAIFDSHSHSNNHLEKESSLLALFKDEKALIKWFYKNLAENCIYSITPIEINQISNILPNIIKTTVMDKLLFDEQGKVIKSNPNENIKDNAETNMRNKGLDCRTFLTNQGYVEGKGLGKNLQGITEPIRAASKRHRSGLGYVQPNSQVQKTNEETKTKYTQFISGGLLAPTLSETSSFKQEIGDTKSEIKCKKIRTKYFENSTKVPTQRIPARTMTVMQVAIPMKGTQLCLSKEIQKGVFTANVIVKPEAGLAQVGVINTRFTPITIENPQIQTEPIYKFNWTQKIKEETKQKKQEKKELLRSNLKIGSSITEIEKEELIQTCNDFIDVFHLPGDQLSHTNVRTFKLPFLADAPITNIKQRRIPYHQQKEVRQQINQLLKDDIIENSISPYNSPLVLTEKKPQPGSATPTFRLCIDFRKINKLAVPYQFPLPRIDEILDQLGKAKLFTTLDLSKGFHQVLIDEPDREKTAFTTPDGHYQYKRCPFGLKTIPGFFQNLLTHILSGLNGIDCFVYIDDVVIPGENVKDHNRKLIEVLTRFRKSNMKLNPAKCQFMESEVTYLGHKCTADGIKPDERLTEAVQNFPRPNSKKQLQSFHGLASYYRKFILGFATIAAPLYQLMKNESKIFDWTAECEQAFNTLKLKLTTEPVLTYPNFEKEFVVTTDASATAVGAILEQEGKVIQYASKTLLDTQKRWSATELELFGVVFGCKTFRHYVLGTRFKVYTDHMPLKGDIKLQNVSNRIARLQQQLSEFDFEIIYKKGKLNSNADCLSRISTEYTNCSAFPYDMSTKYFAITRAQHKNNNKNKEPHEVNQVNKNNIGKTNQKGKEEISVTPVNIEAQKIKATSYPEELHKSEEIAEILRAHHDSILGGHFGANKTFNSIKKKYTWKGMKRDILKYVSGCEKCQKNKQSIATKMPLQIVGVSKQPFDKVFVDIVGPLTTTNSGNKYIISMVDDLTRFVEFAAIPDQQAKTISRALFEHILCRYNIPKELVTDNGTNFVGNTFKQLCKMFNVKKLRTTIYHPQSNVVERQHSTLGNYLRIFSSEHPTTWDEFIRPAAHAYNNTPHSDTRLAPMEVLYGFASEIPCNLKRDPEPVYNLDSYCNELKYKLRTMYGIARQNLLKKKVTAKLYYDKKCVIPIFKVGDKVLRINKMRSSKLSSKYEGPYVVTKIDSPTNVTIKKGHKELRVHKNLLKIFV